MEENSNGLLLPSPFLVMPIPAKNHIQCAFLDQRFKPRQPVNPTNHKTCKILSVRNKDIRAVFLVMMKPRCGKVHRVYSKYSQFGTGLSVTRNIACPKDGLSQVSCSGPRTDASYTAFPGRSVQFYKKVLP